MGEVLREVVLCGGFGVLGGFMFAVLHMVTELAWFHMLEWLQKRGHSQRLGPTTNGLLLAPAARDFFTTFFAFMPIPAVMCACR